MGEKNQEVELRVLLKDVNKVQFSRKLLSIQAKKLSVVHIKDIYFCPNAATCFADTEMDEVGTFALRLRKTIKKGIQSTELNVKVITNHADHNAWEEHEVEVNSITEMTQIIKTLGYKSFIEINKKRSTYQIDDILLNIEDIEDFGLGLELEIITSKDKTEEAKSRLRDILKRLDIGEDRIVPKSITNIIMQTKAKF